MERQQRRHHGFSGMVAPDIERNLADELDATICDGASGAHNAAFRSTRKDEA